MASTGCHRNEDYKLYNIKFYEESIQTIVTSRTAIVDQWISKACDIQKDDDQIIGLDTEWVMPKSNHDHQKVEKTVVAILQLCVGNSCLIFQLFHKNEFPQSLVDFLSKPNFIFVGVSVKKDVQMLLEKGLRVSNAMDVAHKAAEKYGIVSYKNLGLKKMARLFLEKEMEKPKHVISSNWAAQELSYAQVEYACIDAFVSFLLGIKLIQQN